MTPDLSEHEIIITREFDFPREVVFKAWSDPTQLARWWGPQGFASTVRTMDTRPGGTFELEMVGHGMTCDCRGTFREIVAPERIVIDGPAENCHPCGAGIPPRSVVTVTFEERGGKTLLTIHTRFNSAADRAATEQAGYFPGWVSCLEGLAKTLAQ